MLTHQRKEEHGLIRKKHRLLSVAPVYLECGQCGRRARLFSPGCDGWNGQIEPEADPDADSAVYLDGEPSRIIVNYSYQGMENYLDVLDDESIDNPQDYFDTFTVYRQDMNGNIEEVLSEECA